MSKQIKYGHDYGNETRLVSLSATYMHHGDSEDESITIESRNNGDGTINGMFMVIKCEGKGFSINDTDEMASILEDFKKRINA